MTPDEEVQKFAEIICEGMNQDDIERLEALGDLFIDGRGCE